MSDLAQEWPVGQLRKDTHRWLTEAKAALAERNTVLHSTHVVWVELPGTTPIPDVPKQWLTHVPRTRKGASAEAPPVHIPFITQGLRVVTARLQQALQGWEALAPTLSVEGMARRRGLQDQ